MMCLGFKPGAGGWEAQTKPWSYGSFDQYKVLLDHLIGAIYKQQNVF